MSVCVIFIYYKNIMNNYFLIFCSDCWIWYWI